MQAVAILFVGIPCLLLDAEMPEDADLSKEWILQVTEPFEWTFVFEAEGKLHTLEITSAHLIQKYFLEHKNKTLVTVRDPAWNCILTSEDDGLSWNVIPIPAQPLGPQTARAIHTTASGAFIAERAGVNEIWRRDASGLWTYTGMRFTWLGSASTAESNGVIMAAEYSSDGAAVARVIRSMDDGRSWHVVMSLRAQADPSPEIRHFHTIAVDPYTGDWYLSSGDSTVCSRIWKSPDDGDTWLEVTDVDVAEPSISYPRSLHRYTDVWFSNEHIIWGTDDRLGGTGSRLVISPKTEPLQLQVIGSLATNDIRAAIDFGDEVGHLLITENNTGYAGIEIVLVTPALNIVPIGILEGQTGYLTSSFSSQKADGNPRSGLRAFARAKDMRSMGGSPRYPYQTWEYKIRRLFRVSVACTGNGSIESDLPPAGCRCGDRHTLTIRPAEGYLFEGLFLDDNRTNVLWKPNPINAARRLHYQLEVVNDMHITASFIPIEDAGLPAVGGLPILLLLIAVYAVSGAASIRQHRHQ